ncbi:MAG TPA: hypothetical protein VFF79_18245 [Conexibacter sp.]|jgi:hypothetical protein|nr:hypothetical protein [Conexibacter sp.]
MSDQLVPFNGGGFLQTRTERQTSRALEQVRSRQVIATAQEIARVEIIADTSQAALLAASRWLPLPGSAGRRARHPREAREA